MRAFVLSVLAVAFLVGCDTQRREDRGADDTKPLTSRSRYSKSREAEKPAATVTAVQIWEEYLTNPLAADAKYKGKVVSVTGDGKLGRSESGKNQFEFSTVALVGLTNAQLARLSEREQRWFRQGAYPSNVVCVLNKEGEAEAAKWKRGESVTMTGVVVGSKKADVWKDLLVELEDCRMARNVVKAEPKSRGSRAPDEKKQAEPKVFKHGGYVLTERVSVKQWVPQQKEFLPPHEGVWATRKEVKGKGLMMIIYGKTKPGADLTKQPGVFRVSAVAGSIITDASGAEYTVIEAEGDDVAWVKLTKPAPKKKR